MLSANLLFLKSDLIYTYYFYYSSPAVALADSAVFTLLGEENQDKYGSQRMFGSIGWAVTMLVLQQKYQNPYSS